MTARLFALLSLSILILAGCTKQDSSGTTAAAPEGEKYLLPSEPAGAIGVSDAHQAVANQPELVVVGRIADKVAGLYEPWDEGKAAFMIADPSAVIHVEDGHEEHDHAHHDEHAHEPHDHGEHDHSDHGHDHGEHDHSAHEHSDHEHVHHDHGHHDHGHDHHGHDHENCPFCERAKGGTGTLAIVQFLGDDGNILPIDSRKLLGLKKNQTVVVSGEGTIDELGNLVVSARGIYIRR